MRNLIIRFLYRVRRILRRVFHPVKSGRGISLLVPFRSDGARRQETWDWLQEYWRNELPSAKVVIGESDDTPFSKTSAVNRAARKAKGDVFVILDADCYISGYVVVSCAQKIRKERKLQRPIWFMPYRRFYRLTDASSRQILTSNPANPFRLFIANRNQTVNGAMYADDDVTSLSSEIASVRGNWYGALIQIMPREAFYSVGGMDERFAGWGGEDVSFMHCLDTLYGKHKTTPNSVTHLWHPNRGETVHTRTWEGQDSPGSNSNLAWRYGVARGDRDRMQTLVDEHKRI